MNPETHDPGIVAFVDQLHAENAEARTLVPEGQNRCLTRDPLIRTLIHKTIRSADDEVAGAVRILRPYASGASEGGYAHPRNGTVPLPHASVIRYCHKCNQPTGFTVPFWINAGWDIVQIDLCDPCAAHAIDVGAIPQVGMREG